MAQLALSRPKIPTKSPQPARGKAARRAPAATGRATRGHVFVGGTGRPATRGEDRPVIELECGITVYPAREEGDRWRAVWYENGERRQCEARTEEKLAAKLEKVTERLTADAPNMERPGADLIAYYLSPDRLPVEDRWSRKHTHTQRRLCERFVGPVIGTIPACQDINYLRAQPGQRGGRRLADPGCGACDHTNLAIHDRMLARAAERNANNHHRQNAYSHAALRARAGPGECRRGAGYWFGAVAGGACRSARTDSAVSQVKPVMMLARWNSPPIFTSRGDWPKPAAARAMVASMVTAVPAL